MPPKSISIHSAVVNGNLSHNRNLLSETVKSFEGMEVTITIEKKKRKRSNEQNAYLWGVVYTCVKQGMIDVGFRDVTIDNIHELMKGKFLKQDLINQDTGEVFPITGHTSKLTTIEFNDYFEQIKQWAAEYLNVYIPDPNEQVTFNF